MYLQEGSRKVQKKLGSFIGIYRIKFYSITDSIRLVVAQYFLTRSFEEIKSGISFNRILDDHARLAYRLHSHGIRLPLPMPARNS
jgi:hypothetical protein